MAVVLITAINNYQGTAAEMAAYSLTGVPYGSRFFQSDTGLTYRLTPAGWVKELTPAS